jgi:UDP-glucose 4-epimerase
VIFLRCFNPVGCEESGILAEDPLSKPTNLMPVAGGFLRGEVPHLDTFGNEYDTIDGTEIRDYIHFMVLAERHLTAFLTATTGKLAAPFRTFNLGRGAGYLMLQLVKRMEEIWGREITVVFGGDGGCWCEYCEASEGRREGWDGDGRGLLECCRDTRNSCVKNPRGQPSW